MGFLDIFASYPIRVIIIEKRGNSFRWFFDRARKAEKRVGDRLIQVYKLLKKRKEIPPPEYKHLHIDKKGREILPLYSPQEGQYLPININNPPNISVVDKDVLFWNILETRKTFEIYPKKQSFWEKYMPYIMIAMTAGLLVFITIMTFTKMGEIASSLNGVSANLAKFAEAMGKAQPSPPLT